MKELKDRLRYALDFKHMTQVELARKAQVSQSNIACILSGRNKSTKSDGLARMALALGVSLSWLAGTSSEDFPKDKEVLDQHNIMFYDLVNGELIATNKYYTFTVDFLNNLHVDPTKCKMFNVNSDAMEPLIYCGDTVLVNCEDNQPMLHNKGNVYAFIFNNNIFIRKIIPSFNSIQIQSLNPSYPVQTISTNDFNKDFIVIGRVVSKIGSGGL